MKERVHEKLFLRYREKGDGLALAAVFDLTARELLGVAAHLVRGAGEAEGLAQRKLPELVRSALAGLPVQYREVLAPLLLEERAPQEIAARLGRAPGTVRQQIQRGLERLRQRLPRELENVVLELSRSTDREDQYDAMYYSLSTFDPKSEAVVRRLLEYIPSSDPNRYGRALWGLSYGVQDPEAALVAEAARALFEARSDASIQGDCLGLVGRYGGAELVPWLQGIADDARRSQSVRDAAATALEDVRAR